jgi:phosphoenolpyruvate-protein phosphotransferase (PTS system enzyme I)
METTLRGVGVSHGVAIGEVRHMGTAVLEPPAKQIPAEEAEREQGRARKAVEAVAADLMARGNLAGGEAQAVLEAQAMMAQDPELMADVERRIAVGSTAERGVYDAFASYRELLAGAGEYLAGRVADLDDVRNRIVARLLGVPMPGDPDRWPVTSRLRTPRCWTRPWCSASSPRRAVRPATARFWPGRSACRPWWRCRGPVSSPRAR